MFESIKMFVFGITAVDSVVSDIQKKVEKLEKIEKQNEERAVEIEQRITNLRDIQHHCDIQAERASKVATKLRNLIDF